MFNISLPPLFSVARFLMGASLWIAVQGPTLAKDLKEATPQGPLEIQSPVRDRIVLNGFWKFLPAVGPSEAAPAGDWGTISVPQSWFNGYAKKGTGPEWATEGPLLRKGWYERQIDVPASWKGRRVILDFRRVSTDATISINGTDCGGVKWPYGQVDITKAALPGATATIRVLVEATVEDGVHDVAMGPDAVQQEKAKNKISSGGLIGEVFMLSEPQGPTVSDVFVKPSFRKKEVTLAIEVTGITRDETASVTASMINVAGKEEQTFKGSISLHAQPMQKTELTFPWANAALWSPDHPNLYTLQLKVDGAAIHDVYPERFGFREFWVDGRKFFLNGQEIRLRPTVLYAASAPGTIDGIDGFIDGMRRVGFNIIEHQPVNMDQRSASSQNREIWCERADEKGMLTIADAVDATGYIAKGKELNWFNPGVRESYQTRLEVDTRRYRNHPSVVMWATTPNRYGEFQDQNPRVLGVRGTDTPLLEWQFQDVHDKAGLDAMSVIRTVDPTRPVYSHAGDKVGDIYTVNHYLDLIPLQEREEWLSDYVKNGDMPYMAVEFGTPLAEPTFLRGRNGYGNSSGSEPLLTEFCAIYLGPKAYNLETADYRQDMVAKYLGLQPKAHRDWWKSFHGDATISQAPAFQELGALFIRNTWRSWRAAGITGGMVPWNFVGQTFVSTPKFNGKSIPFQPGMRGAYRGGEDRFTYYFDTNNGWAAPASGQAFMEVNGATLAWIAGAPENFYEKAHSFRPGQTVKKQVCLVNDLSTEAPYHVTWRVLLEGKPVQEKTVDGKIAVASNLFLPLSFSLPKVVKGEKVQGEIVMEATIGDRASTDHFPFHLLNVSADRLPKMAVFDPEGKTAEMLKHLGADTVPWDGKAFVADRPLLVVGRNALSGGKPPGDLEKFVNGGGHLLVMAQNAEWMRNVPGFRINRQVSRRFFPVMMDYPITAGLDAEDLRDWAGAGTLIEARPVVGDLSSPTAANYGWHWGNQGSVSCAAVEKPHMSGWTPIIEGEFDMAYSPLMQLNYGTGVAILCTLDLEDQASADPVAEILARRILQQAAALAPAPRKKTVYLGGDEDAKLLQNMGVVFTQAASLPTPDELAIIGARATVTPQQLNSFANQGGKVLVLAAPVGQNVLGEKVANRDGFFGVTDFQSTFNSPLAGLSVSDLHFRTGVSWPLFTQGGTLVAEGLISPQPVGKGMIVATQLDPRLLNADKVFYFRFTRWRQTRALAQLLTNLGASFAADGNLFHTGSKASLYYPDYNPHVWDGDDPARYYRW